jgi:hypothetical protein
MAKIDNTLPPISTGSGGVSIHNDLSGLNVGDYIHLTTLEKTKFNNLPNSFAPVDAEKNVNTDWNAVSGDEELLNKPSTFPPSAHTHVEANIIDLDKYTQLEVDNFLSNKFDNPTGNNTEYLDGSGVPTVFPTIPSIAGLATETYVDDGLDLKANLTQVGNLLREEFTFSGSQTFTLASNYGQVYSVEVQGQGALSTSQYTLVAPNQITINDTLDSGDYVVVIYSNAITGIQPYYSQAEVDALLALKQNKNFVYKNTTATTPHTGITNETNVMSFTIGANSFSTDDIMRLVTLQINKVGIANTANIRLKFNSVNNFATSTTVATLTVSASNLYNAMQRNFNISGGNLKGLAFSISSNTDFTGSNTTASSYAYDVTQPLYCFVSVALNSALDSVSIQNILITN